MKTLIIYHRVDWDGYTSAAVALRAFPKADLLGWTYGDPLPDTSDYDKVILVDLTIYQTIGKMVKDYSWMDENASKLIWIDHHVSTILDVNRADIPGLRVYSNELNIGAAVLAWEYFFPNEIIPIHVGLVATYDIFRKDGLYGAWDDAWDYMMYLDTVKMTVKNASRLINKSDEAIYRRIDTIGRFREWLRPFKESIRFKRYAKEFTFNGYKAYKLDTTRVKNPGRPATLMHEHMNNEPCIVFQIAYRKPDGSYKISIRVSASCDLNANEIARQYGGGGHPKAAGCSMTEDQINNL